MAKKPATQADLGDLHRLVASAFKQRLEQDIEDNVPTDAATLGALIKFLKDNSITADPADADDLGDLREKLKAQAEQRKQRVGNVISLAAKDLSEDDYQAMQG